jgi:4-hydroxythreonine-4-phosphate dehydrogenase
MSAAQPRIALTLGDPCGIGPEIVLKALAEWPHRNDVMVIGDTALLAREAQRLQLPMPNQHHSIGPDCSALEPGQINACAGEASFQYVEHAISAAVRGEVGAIVTAPIAKEAWHLAGHQYPGHTELLSARCGDAPVRMMLANPQLRVVLVTIHLSLLNAIRSLSIAQIEQTIRITQASLNLFGLRRPRIAVAGLNPHAGESGLFGQEEIELIKPAIRRTQADGIDVNGPFAPDTIFMRARGLAEFDVVIAMYHDQGLIPVKYLGVDDGVNTTLGLPFLRTSPDHGTAFDIAGRVDSQGQGLADPRSLICALTQARDWLVNPNLPPSR